MLAGVSRDVWRLAAVVGGLLAAGSGCTKNSPAAPSLAATCSANPSSGPAPLTVSFSLNVSGASGAFTVRIDYGDGEAGTDPAERHTYARPGSYSAGFTVTTPNQSARCSAEVEVTAAPATPTPTPRAEDQPPDAVFRTTPEPGPGDSFRGTPPLTIQFNMCASTDPDGDPIRFRTDLDGDGVFEGDGFTGGDCRRSHTYREPGGYAPQLCLTDVDPSSRTPLHPFRCKTYDVRLRKPA